MLRKVIKKTGIIVSVRRRAKFTREQTSWADEIGSENPKMTDEMTLHEFTMQTVKLLKSQIGMIDDYVVGPFYDHEGTADKSMHDLLFRIITLTRNCDEIIDDDFIETAENLEQKDADGEQASGNVPGEIPTKVMVSDVQASLQRIEQQLDSFTKTSS